MKFNFRKVSAIASSVLMLGLTAGIAAAASFPAPFSGSSSTGVGIVSGTGAGVDDTVATNSIATYLATKVRSSGGTISGGESVEFQKTSTKWQLGKGLLDIKSTSITDSDLPILLADGTFTDDDNDEFDYTQKIQMANMTLNMFEDNDYATDEPTIGIKISSGVNILNYTLDFTENPLFTDLPTATLPLMGKEYYILSVASTNLTLTLLDSAEDTVLQEGSTATVAGHTVSINFISSSEVILNVDGVNTNTLNEQETQKLSDGSYVGVKDILYNTKEGTLSSVEFSIGKGKLVLTQGSDVELNEDTIDDMSVSINGGGVVTTTLNSLMIQWDADDELFVTPTSEITMPGFETLKVSMTEMFYPLEEEIEFEHQGNTNMELANFPLDDSVEDIPLLEWDVTNSWFELVGKDSDEMMLSTNATNVTFDKDLHEWMPVSWSDGDDTQSIMMRATSFKTVSSTINKTTFQYRKNNAWVDAKKEAQVGDDFTIGNIEITIGAINKDLKTVNFWRGNPQMRFDVLYTAEGAKLYLPWTEHNATSVVVFNLSADPGHASLAAACAAKPMQTREVGAPITYNLTTGAYDIADTCGVTTVPVVFSEEDKDDNTGSGGNVTVTLGVSGTADEVDVLSIGYSGGSGTSTEILETDVFRNFVYSALATETLFDKSGTQETLKLIYHGAESYGRIFLTSADASVSGIAGGNMVFTDAEKSSWQSRDVVLVGGSCINSATAEALGVAYPTCASAWESAIGIGSGQFLIQSVGNAFTSGKIALVVAGYEKADTAAAASRLVNEAATIDTTAGNKYIYAAGVSGTSTKLSGP